MLFNQAKVNLTQMGKYVHKEEKKTHRSKNCFRILVKEALFIG